MANFCGKHSFFGVGKRMGRGFFSMGDWECKQNDDSGYFQR